MSKTRNQQFGLDWHVCLCVEVWFVFFIVACAFLISVKLCEKQH